MPREPGRSFALLWLSQALSALGTSVSTLAYPLVMLDATGSALAAGSVGAVVAGVGLAVRVPGGMIADRFRHQTLLMCSDAARAAVVGAMAAAVLFGWVTVPLVLTVVALEMLAGAVFGPAEFALVRALVPVRERALAVGRMQSRSQLAGLAGPVLGGALYGLAPAAPFLLDALSYLASLAMVIAVSAPHTGRRGGQTREPAAVRAWQWLRAQRFLLLGGVWVAVLTAAFGGVGLAILILARDHGASPGQIGAMFTISAAGGFVGAVLTPVVQRKVSPVGIFRAAATVDLAATVALLWLESPYTIGAVGAAAFFFAPSVTAALFGELSVRCPDHLAGRAQGAMALIVGLPAPLAPVAVGAAVQSWGVLSALAVIAGVFGVLAILTLVLPGPARCD